MMDDRSLKALTIKKPKRFMPLHDYGGPHLFLASTNAMKFEYTAAFQQLSTELIMRESVAAPRIPKGSLGGGIGSCFRLRHF
jgi:hypothetical protein